MLRGLGDAAFADVDAALGWQHNVDEADLFQFGEHFSGFVAEAGLPASLRKSFPQDIGQETDEDMSLDSLGFLVPDGTDAQVALVDAKCGLGLGELDIGAPEVFGAPVGYVAAQEIASLAEFGPGAPVVDFAPCHTGPAIGPGIDLDVKQPGCPAVESFEASDPLRNRQGFLLFTGASLRDFLKPFPDALGKALVHGLFFFAPVGAAT